MNELDGVKLGDAAAGIGRELGALAVDAEIIGRLLQECEGAAALTWPKIPLALAVRNVREALELTGPKIALDAMGGVQVQLVGVAARLDSGAGDKGEAVGLGLILAGVRAVEFWLRAQVAAAAGPGAAAPAAAAPETGGAPGELTRLVGCAT
jgi:hypothetical protein